MSSAIDRADESDAGFSMIEVVVAMFVLLIFSLALIPAFITGLRATANNTTLATASQLVSQQINKARSFSTCQALRDYQTQPILPVVDARGVSLQPALSPITCPATYPGTVTVTASVSTSGSSTVLSSATTYVYVGSA